MSIDTAAILAARYHSDPSPLKAAVLGQGGADINPYAALRALQLQKEAERYQMAEAAMRGQQAAQQPSLVQQALQSARAQMPPQQMPQQMPPQQPSPGLAGMPVPEGEYAGGGIVAFDKGGDVDELTPEMLDQVEDQTAALQGDQASPGAPVSYNAVANMLPGLLQNIQNTKYEPMTDKQWEQAYTKRRELLARDVGEDPIEEIKTKLAALDTERIKGLEEAKGLATLAAAGDVLQPGGLWRGLGAAGKTFATQYGQAVAADKAEQRALMSMRFNLADAQRKEKMGLNREAIAAADQARADHAAAQRFGLDKNKALATVASGMARATRPTAAGAGGPKGFDNLAAKYYAAAKLENDKLPPEKRKPDAIVEAESYQRAAADWAKVPAGETIGLKKEQNIIEGRKVDISAGDANTRRQEALTHWQKGETERQKAIAEEKKKLRTDRTYITATPEQKAAREKAIEDKYPSLPKPVQSSAAPSEPAFPEQSTSRTSVKAPAKAPEKAPAKTAEKAPAKTAEKAPAKAPEKAPAKTDKSGNKNSQAKPAGGKVVTKAQLQATAKQYGKSYEDAVKAAKAKGYTIKE